MRRSGPRCRAGARSSRDATRSAPETPQGIALQPWIRHFDLSRQPFADLIDGVEMDLDRSCYDTFDDLREYCWRVASTVGLVCIEIFGQRSDRAREYAVHLGIALQLTNILRDVGGDAERGRIYLPQEDLRRFGCTNEDLRAGMLTAGVRQLLAFQRQRAVEYYARAAELQTGLDATGAGRGRNHGANLPRDARPHRAGRLRRLLTAHPCAPRAPDRHRRRHVDADQVRPPCPGLTSSSSAPALPASARRCVWSRPVRACSSSRNDDGWAAAPPRLPTRRPARSSTTASTRCLAAIARPSRFSARSTPTGTSPSTSVWTSR